MSKGDRPGEVPLARPVATCILTLLCQLRPSVTTIPMARGVLLAPPGRSGNGGMFLFFSSANIAYMG